MPAAGSTCPCDSGRGIVGAHLFIIQELLFPVPLCHHHLLVFSDDCVRPFTLVDRCGDRGYLGSGVSVGCCCVGAMAGSADIGVWRVLGVSTVLWLFSLLLLQKRLAMWVVWWLLAVWRCREQ